MNIFTNNYGNTGDNDENDENNMRNTKNIDCNNNDNVCLDTGSMEDSKCHHA